MITYKPLQFIKAKYVRRWKGKDGKWRYEYPRPKAGPKKKAAPKKTGSGIAYSLQDQVWEKEQTIYDLDHEECFAFDETGNILVTKSGAKDYIEFDPDESLRIERAKVFTHNHPGGGSFSPEDIRMLFLAHLEEMRAVGVPYAYSAKMPAPRWTLDKWNDFVRDMRGAEARTRKKFMYQINKGVMTYEEASKEHWHEIWTELAKKHKGFEYKRTVGK